MKKKLLLFGFFIATISLSSVFLSAKLIDNDDKPAVKNETANAYFARIRNNQVTGTIDPNDILKARAQASRSNELKGTGEFDFNWTLLGPNNLGGRTRAILFDNRDAEGKTLYAGSVLGGIYKSTTTGDGWTRIDLGEGNLNVTCITQTSNGDLYVGTGEAFNTQKYTVLGEWKYPNGLLGHGIFKSTDGENFTLLEATKPTPNTNNVDWAYIYQLASDQGTGRVFASTNMGLRYTEDGGGTWSFAHTQLGTNLDTLSKDVKIASDGTVIAEVNNHCFVSINGDPNNFVQYQVDTAWNIQPITSIGRLVFAFAPSQPAIAYVVAVTANGALAGVYRSDDKGVTWNLVGPGGSQNFNLFNTGSNVSDGQGLNTCAIQVFPDDPYHIIIGGLEMWEGKKILVTGFYDWRVRSNGVNNLWLAPDFIPQGHHAYVFRPGFPNTFFTATNGGIAMCTVSSQYFSFQPMNKDYIASQFYTVGLTQDKQKIYGGAQDLGSIFIDGTMNPSNAKRGNDIWTTVANVPDGRNGGYVANSVIYPSAVLYSRTPHPAKNGNIELFVRRNEFGGGPNYSATMFSDRYASTSFLSPFILWESFEDYNGRDSVKFKAYSDYPSGSVIWPESNNASRQFPYALPAPLNHGDSIMVQDPVAAKFFICGDYRVLMTKEIIQFNKSPEWFVISDKDHSGLMDKDTLTSMALSKDANHLFVGSLKGKLYRISNIAYAYDFDRADVTSPYCIIATRQIPVYLPGTNTEISQIITSISVNPNNPNNVIITLGNYGNQYYAFMTENALDENPVFSSIQGDPNNGGLPQVPAYSSLIEMDASKNLAIIGTEFGIYSSTNFNSENPTWTAQNRNIGRTPVFMLKQQLIGKADDVIPTILGADTTWITVKGTNNFGVIYGATYGSGLIALDEFEQPVGINEPGKDISHSADFRLYPNPANDRVTVSYHLSQGTNVTISVYDLNGRRVMYNPLGTKQAGDHNLILNCGDLRSGTYIMQVVTGTKRSSSKFVVY
jgi:hypothetical protein